MPRRRTLFLLPIALLGGIFALGSLAGAAPRAQLEAHLTEARTVVKEMVHQGARELADRTDETPPARPAAQPRAVGPDPALRTGPAPRPAARPTDSTVPTRALDGRAVPDFVALQDDAREPRRHSGRRPTR